MKITSEWLTVMHLVDNYLVLCVADVRVLYELYRHMDIFKKGLNCIQFHHCMSNLTDMSRASITKLFSTFKSDKMHTVDFNNFYFVVCMLIAAKDGKESQFLRQHSRTIFRLLDKECSGAVSVQNLLAISFIFNIQPATVRQVLDDLFLAKAGKLTSKQFFLVTMACFNSDILSSRSHSVWHRFWNYVTTLSPANDGI